MPSHKRSAASAGSGQPASKRIRVAVRCGGRRLAAPSDRHAVAELPAGQRIAALAAPPQPIGRLTVGVTTVCALSARVAARLAFSAGHLDVYSVEDGSLLACADFAVRKLSQLLPAVAICLRWRLLQLQCTLLPHGSLQLDVSLHVQQTVTATAAADAVDETRYPALLTVLRAVGADPALPAAVEGARGGDDAEESKDAAVAAVDAMDVEDSEEEAAVAAGSSGLDLLSLYDAIRPPVGSPQAKAPLELAVTLRPYQARALAWLQARELPGWTSLSPSALPPSCSAHDLAFLAPRAAAKRLLAQYAAQARAVEDGLARAHAARAAAAAVAASEGAGGLHPLWLPLYASHSGSGRGSAEPLLYFNRYTGSTCLSPPAAPPALAGGILAEEMGLGKTVEMVALLLANGRTPPLPHLTAVRGHWPAGAEQKLATVSISRAGGGIESLLISRATLIATPISILHQWASEIRRHAPSLRVVIYPGLAAAQKAGLSICDVCCADVVLCSYRVLAKEVYIAEVATRRLRHAKRYVAARSWLTRVQWWRVLLDEAQFVESTVSKVAAMAAHLSAVQRWCVTGTPIGQGGLEDLFGLLRFLRHPIFARRLWWKSHLLSPFLERRAERMVAFLSQLMWRHSKAHVLAEVNLPPCVRERVLLKLSPVEAEFYASLRARQREQLRALRSDGLLTDAAVRSMLHQLRLAACHPQLVASALLDADARARRARRRKRAARSGAAAGRRRRRRSAGSSGAAAAAARAGASADVASAAAAAAGVVLPAVAMSMEEVMQSMMTSAETALQMEQRDLCRKLNEVATTLARLKRRDAALRLLRESWTVSQAVVISRVAYADEAAVVRAWKLVEVRTAAAIAELAAAEGREEEAARFQRERDSVIDYCLAPLRRREAEVTSLLEWHATVLCSDESALAAQFIDSAHVDRRLRSLLARRSAAGTSVYTPRFLCAIQDTLEAVYARKGSLGRWWKLAELSAEAEAADAAVAALRAAPDVVARKAAVLRQLCATRERTPALAVCHHGGAAAADELRDVMAERHRPSLEAMLMSAGAQARTAQRHVRAALAADDGRTALQGWLPSAAPLSAWPLSAFATPFADCQNNARLLKIMQDEEKSLRQLARLTERMEALSDDLQAACEGDDEEGEGSDEQGDEQGEEERKGEEAARESKWEARLKNESAQLATLQSSVARKEQRIRYLRHKQAMLTAGDGGSSSSSSSSSSGSSAGDGGAADSSAVAETQREESAQCVICFATGRLMLPPCAHPYCKDCVTRLFARAASAGQPCTCAICRTRLTRGSMFTVEAEGSSSSDCDDVTRALRGIKLAGGSFGSKVDTLLRYLLHFAREDSCHKSLVFSRWPAFLALVAGALASHGISFVTLTGTPAARAASVARFQSQPEVAVFLLNARSDSSGLTLTAATTVFLMEPSLNPATEEQAINRVHRIGQTRPTHVYRFVSADTVEEAVVATQEERMQLVRGTAALRKEVEDVLATQDVVHLLT